MYLKTVKVFNLLEVKLTQSQTENNEKEYDIANAFLITHLKK